LDFDCEEIAICGISAFECLRRHSDHEKHVKNILRWFAGISAIFERSTEHSLQPTRPASDIAAETRSESAATQGGTVASTTESAVATPTTATTLIAVATADAKVGVVPVPPDQPEIQRRRELVRTLFNDFWSGCDDKPAAFVDRLNQAEMYLNERLTASGERWQLDAKTRQMLGLPPRSNSRNQGNGAAHP
jgi:hypothetical protein